MNQSSPVPRAARNPFSAGIKRFSVLLVLPLLLAALPAFADPVDDQYLRIITILDRADALNEKKQGDLGKAAYLEAGAILLNLRKQYPTWNTKMVGSRLSYVAGKIEVLLQTNKVEVVTGDNSVAKPQTKSAAGGAGAVKLISAGAEPRKILRLQAKAGDKQAMTTTMTTAMDMGPAGVMKMPAVKMLMDVTVTSVSPDGDITCETVTGETTMADDPGGNPAIADAMKANLGSVAGMKSTSTISSRGVGKANDLKLPAGTDAKTRKALEQMKESFASANLALPEEAVGAGAKWEVKQAIKSQGMTINQTLTYQLVSVEGDLVNIKSTIAQSAANQKIESPQMPGMKLDLTKMTGHGTGSTTFDLTHVMPAKATLNLHTEISMGLNLGGQVQSMNMKMDVTTLLESK